MSLVMNHIKSLFSGNSSARPRSSGSEKSADSYQLETSQNNPTPPPSYSPEPTCGQQPPKPFVLEFQRPAQQGYRVARPEGRNGQRFLYRPT
ncbi:hypothetical protein QYS62_004904 [Fusarium acuminatum]|uniref:Uncharacterized protein n=1 Tax=Fusarium acuminatum TaxID=5515 RepID=A0ABZ2WT36_9HYPO